MCILNSSEHVTQPNLKILRFGPSANKHMHMYIHMGGTSRLYLVQLMYTSCVYVLNRNLLVEIEGTVRVINSVANLARN